MTCASQPEGQMCGVDPSGADEAFRPIRSVEGQHPGLLAGRQTEVLHARR